VKFYKITISTNPGSWEIRTKYDLRYD